MFFFISRGYFLVLILKPSDVMGVLTTSQARDCKDIVEMDATTFLTDQIRFCMAPYNMVAINSDVIDASLVRCRRPCGSTEDLSHRPSIDNHHPGDYRPTT